MREEIAALTETFGRISGLGLAAETALERLGERFEVSPAGDCDRPYPLVALREMFSALTARLLGGRGAEAAWSPCQDLGRLENARELGDRLRFLEAAA